MLQVTIAGGITTAEEVAELDRLGCDAQVGMALYTGRLGLAEAFAAPSQSDRPDGLWPTVVVDERGVALGFCHSDLEFPARRARAGPGRSTTRARAACGSRARPRARPRSCCGSTPTATATACASRCASSRRASATWARAPAGARTRGLGDARPPPRRAQGCRRPRAPTPPGCSPIRSCSAAKLREEAAELAEAEARADAIHEAADRALLHPHDARPPRRRPRRGRARPRPPRPQGHPPGVKPPSRAAALTGRWNEAPHCPPAAQPPPPRAPVDPSLPTGQFDVLSTASRRGRRCRCRRAGA